MKGFFKSSKFKILIGVLFISFGVLLYTSSYQENFMSSAISLLTIPVQQLATRVSNSAEDLLKIRKDKEQLENEISDLKRQLREQRDLTADYYEVKKQNVQYEKYYEFKRENPSLKYVSASVIGQDSTELFGGFTIDHGSSSGISVNDAVITDNGLVGWVCQVTTNSSRVKTILSPETKISVVDIVSNDAGVINGSLLLSQQNLTKMTLIRNQSNINTGDMIITTGISGMYPKNIKIGQIKSIEHDEYDASSYAVVEPYEDVRNIRDVFVVTNFNGKGEVILDDSSNT